MWQLTRQLFVSARKNYVVYQLKKLHTSWRCYVEDGKSSTALSWLLFMHHIVAKRLFCPVTAINLLFVKSRVFIYWQLVNVFRTVGNSSLIPVTRNKIWHQVVLFILFCVSYGTCWIILVVVRHVWSCYVRIQ
jgi:hypothetical protein